MVLAHCITKKYCYSYALKRYYSREAGIYDSYDIIVKCDNIIVEHISDISNDLNWIKKFVSLLNKNDVCVDHLRDLIYDFMP